MEGIDWYECLPAMFEKTGLNKHREYSKANM